MNVLGQLQTSAKSATMVTFILVSASNLAHHNIMVFRLMEYSVINVKVSVLNATFLKETKFSVNFVSQNALCVYQDVKFVSLIALNAKIL